MYSSRWYQWNIEGQLWSLQAKTTAYDQVSVHAQRVKELERLYKAIWKFDFGAW